MVMSGPVTGLPFDCRKYVPETEETVSQSSATEGSVDCARLRPAQSEHAAEGSHQLVLQLHLLGRRRSGATSIEHKHSVLDKPRRNNGIDAFGNAVLQAAGGITRAIAQEQIGYRAVAVVDDS